MHSRVERIPGWLHPEAALLTAELSAVQRTLGITGALLEIGVFKGKYLSVLYEASVPSDIVVGVDLFVGAEDARRVAEEVRANVAAACGSASRLNVTVADSLHLTAAAIRAKSECASFRFISIDGGHTKDVVSHDLELAAEILQAGRYHCLGRRVQSHDARRHRGHR